jgi:hypothetical protein
LTFSDSFGHFIAITAIELAQKMGVVPKLDQTLTGHTADLGGYDPGPNALVMRHDAAHSI